MSFPVPFRKNLLSLEAYVPGKPLEELERELGITKAAKLASNENPLGPSPGVLEALRRAEASVHRYPDGAAHNLGRALAEHLKVDVDRIFLGNGSNELIVRLGQMVLHPGEEVLYAEPGFFVYYSTAKLFEAVPRPLPLRDFTHDLDLFARAITPKTKVAFLANPNNPTGTMVSLAKVEGFLKSCPPHVLVVLDEAYFEYVDDPSFQGSLGLLDRYPNLVVLRTFSKAHGLAGLRVGYGIAHPELVSLFQRIREPFNVNSMAMAAAEAALRDPDHLQKVVDLNRAMRSKLAEGLRGMGLHPAPSQANFVYFEVPDAPGLYLKLLKTGLIVRPMGPKALRVTTGTQEETERFLRTFGEMLTAVTKK